MAEHHADAESVRAQASPVDRLVDVPEGHGAISAEHGVLVVAIVPTSTYKSFERTTTRRASRGLGPRTALQFTIFLAATPTVPWRYLRHRRRAVADSPAKRTKVVS